jgi:hypothetical protein
MLLTAYRLLWETQRMRKGRPVTQAQIEAQARAKVSCAGIDVQAGLERLATAGLAVKITVDRFTEEERELWSALGGVPADSLTTHRRDRDASREPLVAAAGQAHSAP